MTTQEVFMLVDICQGWLEGNMQGGATVQHYHPYDLFW
jgi:hypothetical protein